MILLTLANKAPLTFWQVVASIVTDPKVWVPAVLSIVAIAVSIFTASQTWRYYPKPLLIAEARRSGGEWQKPDTLSGKVLEGPFMAARIVNRGNGTAYDMRVTVKARGMPSLPANPDIGRDLEPGKSERFSVAWGEATPVEARTNPEPNWTIPKVDVKRARFVVRWRQAPRMKCWKSKRIKFDGSAAEHDGSMW